jgi:cyclase
MTYAPLIPTPGRPAQKRRVRVIPTLLIDSGGRLVKTIKFGKRTYIGDPINAVQIYSKKEVDELIVFDIDATSKGREPNYDRIEELASEAFMPLGYGGGIRTMEQIARLYDCGIEKVILSSVLRDDPALVERAAVRYGSQAVTVCLPVGKGLIGGQKVRLEGGKKVAGDPVSLAKQHTDRGSGEIILYSIDRDGTWEGYDLELTRRIASAVDVPVVACGGAGSVLDFASAVIEGGASAAAAGSLFTYQAKGRGVLITYPDQATLTRDLFEKVS